MDSKIDCNQCLAMKLKETRKLKTYCFMWRVKPKCLRKKGECPEFQDWEVAYQRYLEKMERRKRGGINARMFLALAGAALMGDSGPGRSL